LQRVFHVHRALSILGAIQEGIRAKMNNDAELKILPLDLLGRGFDIREVLDLRV
jgi:hypothetical protein